MIFHAFVAFIIVLRSKWTNRSRPIVYSGLVRIIGLGSNEVDLSKLLGEYQIGGSKRWQ